MMKKLFTVACIGVGARGVHYMSYMKDMGEDKFKIVSLCEKNKERLEYGKSFFNVPDKDCYFDEEAFFKNLKADLCIVATQDQDHVGHAIKAIKAGCDVLCEKPISNKEEEIKELLRVQKQYKKRVIVCHVLRYAAAFMFLKNAITNKEIGDLVMIDDMENVWFPHQAHSFVRGNWRNSNETSPMILAKCCHDFDIFVWLTNSKCDSVSSIGDLTYFKKENQPEGASDRCKDCKYRGTCLYDAYHSYIDNKFWGREMITNVRPITDEAVREALDNGPYGRCVFACDNNVVDNEVCIMRFKNNVVVNLRMSGFTAFGGRIVKVYGTKGQIDLDESKGILEVKIFDQPIKTLEISSLTDTVSGHGGGDKGLIESLYKFLCGKKVDNITSLPLSIESHMIAFAAEKSRLQNGKMVKVKR